MKNLMLSIAVIGAFILTTFSARADTGDDVYAGVQYAVSDITADVYPADFSPGLVVFRFGKSQNDFFALEARVGTGVNSDKQEVPGSGSIILESALIYGGYGILRTNLYKSSSVYGLAGVTYSEMTTAVVNQPRVTLRDNGMSIGVGADVDVGNNISLNLEYVSYINNSDSDIRALGFGLVIGY